MCGVKKFMLDRKEFSSDDVHWELTPSFSDKINKFRPIFYIAACLCIGAYIGYSM